MASQAASKRSGRAHQTWKVQIHFDFAFGPPSRCLAFIRTSHRQAGALFHVELGTVLAAAAPGFRSAVTSCPSSDCRPAPAKQARRRTHPDQEQSIYISDGSSSDGTAKAVGKRQRRSRSPPHSGTQHHRHNGAQQHSDDAQLEAMLACKAVR